MSTTENQSAISVELADDESASSLSPATSLYIELNPYDYVENIPINRIDVLGLFGGWGSAGNYCVPGGYWSWAGDTEVTQENLDISADFIETIVATLALEGVATTRIGCACSKIRCVVRWHDKHHPFNGVRKCHLEFQCYIKGKSGKPNTIYVPLPDRLCPPNKK